MFILYQPSNNREKFRVLLPEKIEVYFDVDLMPGK